MATTILALLSSAMGLGLGLAEPVGAEVVVKALPSLLKAAKIGAKHMHGSQRMATEQEIAAIERSGAARSVMGGWFR